MKKSFTKLASVAIIVCVAVGSTVTFQSCSQDAENIPVAETQLTTEQAFAKDLQKLANAQRKLAQQMFVTSNNRRTGESVHDCTIIPVGVQTASQEMAAIMSEIIQKYDLTADLTEHQIEGLYFDEEQREVLALDPDAFSAYIEEYKSEEFNNIMNAMLQNPSYNVSVESIIQNSNLKMNEKLGLLAITIMDECVVDALVMDPQPLGPDGYKVASCEDRFNAARRFCLTAYEIEIAAIITVDFLSGGTGSLLMAAAYLAASAQYANCEMEAKYYYDACVYDRNHRKLKSAYMLQ